MVMESRQPIGCQPLKYSQFCCPIVPRNVKQRVRSRRQYALRELHPRRARAVHVRRRSNRPRNRNAAASNLRHVVPRARQVEPLRARPRVRVVVGDEARGDGQW